ncbi:hypothetical protein GGX14DRAFT_407607 [Mycena pura]|uniref:Uncharacterized protein n=1 Tax=Mycena pura TaxID=153505 RepID=A0AAD6UPE6_9AGAR|nr:hypothetical protein GGX14DRAFT_407607 [Mycena pura]
MRSIIASSHSHLNPTPAAQLNPSMLVSLKNMQRLTAMDAAISPNATSRAREKAFTRTNIVRGFEKAGIYPLNRRALPAMRAFFDHEQSVTTPATPTRCDEEAAPSTALTPITNMRQRLPALGTPDREAAAALVEKCEKERAHSAFLSGRIRELHDIGLENRAPADRRQPKGKSRVYTLDVLREELAKRDAHDAQRGRGGRGGGRRGTRRRGRPSGGRGYRGRGAGKMLIDVAPNSGDELGSSDESEDEFAKSSDEDGADNSNDSREVGRKSLSPPRRAGLRPRKRPRTD